MARIWEDHDRTALRLPGPDEDATPFVLRCYVKHGSFRPLIELEPDRRPLYEEYKIYVWRSATLRDIATLLYARDRSISSPMSLHAFRVVYFDDIQSRCVARDVGQGVTRLSSATLKAALNKAVEPVQQQDKSITAKKQKDDQVMDEDHAVLKDSSFDTLLRDLLPSFPREANEEASRVRLSDLQLQDGDILDCVITTRSSNVAEHGRRVQDNRRQR